MRYMRRLFGFVAFLSTICGLALVLSSCTRLKAFARRVTGHSTSAPTLSTWSAPAPTTALLNGVSIADIAAKVTPSVVNVFSERKIAPMRRLAPFFPDPTWRFFFGPGDAPGPERREKSLGSGVIVSKDGIIVTNDHVVENADSIRVAFNDGREVEAKLVGTDSRTDLAVLRVNAGVLPAIDMADSSKIRIGDVVLAVGDPFGVGETVTMGIVSAVGRANLGLADYEDFIQTDAAINPGNSGGALVDMAGRLVGINTAILSRSGGSQGVGFAIPSKMVDQVEHAILAHGKVDRGWLGVAIQNLDADLAKAMSVAPNSGALVSDVTAGSPAEHAGIRRGDVITAVDGQATRDSAQVKNLVALAGEGKSVDVTLRRDGKTLHYSVTLGVAPGDGRVAVAPLSGGESAGPFSGIRVSDLDSRARQRLRVPERFEGVVVTGVEAQNDNTYIRVGDVIMEIDGKPTQDMSAYRRALQRAKSGSLCLIYRNGMPIYVVVGR